ncbi:hypothetical protein PTKIN_Ptkin16aG0529100 [Pterospermum kingtungense]
MACAWVLTLGFDFLFGSLEVVERNSLYLQQASRSDQCKQLLLPFGPEFIELYKTTNSGKIAPTYYDDDDDDDDDNIFMLFDFYISIYQIDRPKWCTRESSQQSKIPTP